MLIPILTGIVAVLVFVLQKTLSNIVAGACIKACKPFRKGQHIEVRQGQYTVATGKVIRVGFFNTRIKTYTKDILALPNDAMLNTFIISNRDFVEKYNHVESIAFSLNSNINAVREILTNAIVSSSHAYNTPENIFITLHISDGKLIFNYNIKTRSLEESFDATSQINMEIVRACQGRRDVELV